MSVCSQMPKQVLPLEVHLIDSEAARRRFEEFSLTNDEMAARQNRLRSNRFVRRVCSSLFPISVRRQCFCVACWVGISVSLFLHTLMIA